MEENENKEVKKRVIISIIISVVIFLLYIYYSYMFVKPPKLAIANIDKPIIYIYPEEEKEVSVTLLDKDLITCSYPKYKEGWNVKAKPNGDLIDLDTGKELYSLYYESDSKMNFKVEKEGFCVKKENIVSFLEEKLETLGLNYKEKEEFIVYWLPQLEKYEYVYIRFATLEEIENNMGLEIEPKPDTLIRVLMTWKGLDEEIEVKEQILENINRKGYTVVEWGGTQI